jgi:beta-lactam-binding protein with PASTA domain
MNGVINQSVSPKTMVAKKSSITISVSLGQVVVVPDFSKISKEEAQSVSLNNAIVKYVEMYQPSTGAKYGSYIWQDVKAGTNVNQSSTTKLVITVYYSLGQPYLNDLTGQKESVIPDIIYNFNKDTANFTYTINYVNNSADKGNIVSMNPTNQYVNPGQHIVFEVSTGTP